MKKHILLRILLAALMTGQISLGGVALAADEPTPTPSVSPSPSPSDSPSPSPTASPSPTPSATPSPTPSPTPTAAPTNGNGKKDKTDCPATGPCEATGTIPSWVYNTGTKTWEESDKSSFTYDAASGYWLSPKYYLDKQLGWYEIVPPAQVTTLSTNFITAPETVHTPLGDVVVGSKDYLLAQKLGIIPSSATPTINSTGPGSNNTVGTTNSDQTWFDLTNLVNVINTLDASAKSGAVSASDNTQVGDASTGSANVLANLINLLSSAWSWSNGGLNVFMQNLFGNQEGDIKFSPTQSVTGGGGALGSTTGVSNTGPNSTNTATTDNSSSLGVNAQNTGNIVNNINANAVSGNADATKNTSAGNVSSGDATAEVNIVNLINSYISAGNSFFGVLNIFGNLNGDVLFPDGFLNGSVPSTGGGVNAGIGTTGPSSGNQVGETNQNTSAITNSSDYGLNNNVNASAASGSAGISDNTSAGKATTGSASTDSSAFNLANSSLFSDNAVLVIVNVLGHWIGKVMDIPGGTSTSALLAGNAQVAATGPDSQNQIASNSSTATKINQANTGSITNNVNANATSGDASAEKNTAVGDVTSGKAKVSTGVTNIVNSVLNVKHWFGVLVVNVFGSWTGDVGDNSSAGDKTPVSTATPPVSKAANILSSPLSSSAPTALTTSTAVTTTPSPSVSATKNQNGHVLAAGVKLSDTTVAAAQTQNINFLFWVGAIVMLLAGGMLALDRRLRMRA